MNKLLELCRTEQHHEYVASTLWIGLDGKRKSGAFCKHCGKWISTLPTKVGEKGGRAGEILSLKLRDTLYPGKLVIVHHTTNYPDRVQLEVEIRAPDHSSATFARINL